MKTLARDCDKHELVARLKAVRRDSVARWGQMSAHQMICHLKDSFLMMLGERQVSDATGAFQRTLMKWIALYAPLRWPPGIATIPEVDQKSGGTRPVEFSTDLAQLEALLLRAAKAPSTSLARRHPIFGRMSEPAWFRWAYLHTDHHLRQFGA